MQVPVGVQEPEQAGWSDVIRLSEPGIHVHRIFYGAIKQKAVYYPSMNSEGKQVTKTVTVTNATDNIFSKLAETDERTYRDAVLAQGMDSGEAQKIISKYRSRLKPSTAYFYAGFVRSIGPVVKHLQYGWGVHQDIQSLQRNSSVVDGIENPSLLMYGPTWSFDIIINKMIDPNKDKRYGTSYTVNPGDKLPLGNQLHPKFLAAAMDLQPNGDVLLTASDKKAVKINAIQAGIFSQEEVKVMLEYDWMTLNRMLESWDKTQIEEKLQEFPLFPEALDYSDQQRPKNMFNDPGQMKQVAKDLGVPIIDSSHQVASGGVPNQVGSGSQVTEIIPNQTAPTQTQILPVNSGLEEKQPTQPVVQEVNSGKVVQEVNNTPPSQPSFLD